MKSLFGIAAFALAAACPVALDGGGTTTSAAADDAPTIALVHQELALAVDADLVVEFHPTAPIADGGSVRVLTYQLVTNRETLGRAIAGRFGGATDRVDLGADAVVIDPASGNVKITVHTDGEAAAATDTSDTTDDSTLRFPAPGLYPVAVQLLGADGKVASQLVTFVDRLPPSDGAPPAAISVAILASITAPPQLPGATTPLPADVMAALAELGRYPAGLPISLDISPEIIGRLDSKTRDSVATAMASGVIMSQPLVPFDPSAATAAGLDDRFGDLLLTGESAIGATGQLPRVTRDVWYASSGVTNAGAQLLRKLGVRLLVIPSNVYLRAGGNNAGLTDYSQLFQTVIGINDDGAADTATTEPSIGDDGGPCAAEPTGCIPTAAIDPALSARLVDSTLSDEQAALYTAADIVTYRDFFAQSMSANSRHALILGLDGTGVASAARVSRAVQMTTDVGAANLITIEQLEANSSQAIADGRPLDLQLPTPDPAPIDLTARSRTLDLLSFVTIPAARAMLVDDSSGRVARWTATVQTLYSSALTDAEVDTAVQSIRDDTARIMECIQPPKPYSFTLTGSSTNLPLRLANNCPEQLKVLVRVGAAAGKMDVPVEDTELTLPANATFPFTIPVTARTNGTFDVTFDVYSPQDLLTPLNQRTPITRRVTLHAHVNTLTGLPQAITGVALLLLVTWWVRNLRRSRRARRSLAATAAHPAAAG